MRRKGSEIRIKDIEHERIGWGGDGLSGIMYNDVKGWLQQYNVCDRSVRNGPRVETIGVPPMRAVVTSNTNCDSSK